MRRRTFLSLAGAAATAASPTTIDSHIHLYDPSRPQGVPWPDPSHASIYRTFLPAHFRKIAEPLGVRNMIAMECSPWVEDNYWVLDVAARDKVVVGVIGNLHPGKSDFREHLERLHKNPLFKGIRFGYIWGRDLAAELRKPEFIADLKFMAAAGLTLDTYGQSRIAGDVIRLSDGAPDLRIVIDHLPSIDPPPETAARQAYEQALRKIAERPQIFGKISEVFRKVDGRIPRDLSFYRPRLDQLWEVFGRDRVLFGSDWTNSEPMGTYQQTVGLVREYFAGKGPDVAERFFGKNAVQAYRV